MASAIANEAIKAKIPLKTITEVTDTLIVNTGDGGSEMVVWSCTREQNKCF